MSSKSSASRALAIVIAVCYPVMLSPAATAAPQSNDDIANAKAIISLPYSDTTDTTSATTAAADPTLCAWGKGYSTVWYTFHPVASGPYLATAVGSSYSTVLAIWQGAPDSLTQVACGFSWSLVATLVAGTDYYIEVAGASTGGSLKFAFEQLTPPTNDDFDAAKLIPVLPYVDTQDTRGGSTSVDDPGLCTAAKGYASVWYAYTPAADSFLTATTSGSGYFTVLAVWTGTRGSLSRVACDRNSATDGKSLVVLPVTAGTTYHIEVAGASPVGTAGPLTLKVTAENPISVPALGDAVDAPSLTWLSGGDVAWSRETIDYYYDGDAAMSGGVSSGQASWIATTVAGPAIVSFQWKASGNLGFSIDGAQPSSCISSIWERKDLVIPAGNHTFLWVYTAWSPSDAGLLDAFTVTPGPALRLKSPVGAEEWHTRNLEYVSWLATEDVGPVKVELFKGPSLRLVIAETTPNVGSSGWWVPIGLEPASDYRIRLSSVDNPALSDTGADYFSITETGLALNGFLTLLSSESYIGAPHGSELDLGSSPQASFTIEGWFYTQRTGWASVMSKGGSYAIYIRMDSEDNCVGWSLTPPSGSPVDSIEACHWHYLPGGTKYAFKGWHHAALVYDRDAGGVLRLYVNGEKWSEDSRPNLALANSIEQLKMGREMRGALDEVRISSTPRYSGETFTPPVAPFACDGNTRALWHFDEPTGATVFHDACGTDNVLFSSGGAHTEGDLNSPPLVRYTLALARNGNGAGTVASGPPGILCGPTCSSQFDKDAPVTLYAVASPGSAFAGWSGEGCGGTGSCTVVMSQARNVTAIFNLSPKEPSIDFNGDSITDTFLYNPAAGNWSQYFGSGSGFANTANGWWSPGWQITPSEFDADGITDLFLYNPGYGYWYKAIGDGSGSFTYFSGQWSAGWDVHSADLNGDGRSDIFLFHPALGIWFRCVSPANPADGFTYDSGYWSPGWTVYTVDWNGDGKADLFLYNKVNGSWYQVTNIDPDPAVWSYSPGSWMPGWDIQPGDFNGDGKSDLFLYMPGSGAWYVAMNTGSGFGYTAGYWAPGWSVYTGDFDGDGAGDIFVYSSSTGQWYQCISDKAGYFSAYHTGNWATVWEVNVEDFSNDGKADVLLYYPDWGVWYLCVTQSTPGSFAYYPGAWNPGMTLVTKR